MMASTIGYIVSEHGSFLSEDKFGVLWKGAGGTVFPDRRAAQRAITRSLKYAKANGLHWTTNYCIGRAIRRVYSPILERRNVP